MDGITDADRWSYCMEYGFPMRTLQCTHPLWTVLGHAGALIYSDVNPEDLIDRAIVREQACLILKSAT